MNSAERDFNDADNAGHVLQTICHGLAKSSGWWTNTATMMPMSLVEIANAVPQNLLLIHSEVSEACEADRKGLMDDKLPNRSGLEVELADAVIRIADLAGALDLDLGGAIADKLRYNQSRQDHKINNRVAKGGKRY